ncbi:RskA family anti-sigma factor [Nocardia aurea]|uniref:RskA family anti-sigma factor n=1 Tax=Nocardia aurea TaxID=2144174 RepID=UPI0033AC4387
MTVSGRSLPDLLESAVPYAIDAATERERRRIERRLHTADAATVAAFSAVLRGTREAVAVMTVLDVVAPPPAVELRVQRALDTMSSQRGGGRTPPSLFGWSRVAVMSAITRAIHRCRGHPRRSPP